MARDLSDDWIGHAERHQDRCASVAQIVVSGRSARWAAGFNVGNGSGWPKRGVYFFMEDGEYEPTATHRARVRQTTARSEDLPLGSSRRQAAWTPPAGSGIRGISTSPLR